MDTTLLLVLGVGIVLGYLQKSKDYLKQVVLGVAGFVVIPQLLSVVGFGGYPVFGVSLNTLVECLLAGYISSRVYRGLL